MKKRALCMVLVLLMCLCILSMTVIAAGNVTLDVNKTQKAEIALAVGNTKVDYSKFETDIKTALEGKGMDASNILITAVQAQSSNTSKNFNWWTYDHSTAANINAASNTYIEAVGSQYTNDYNSKLNHIETTNNGATMDFYGYGSSGYKDFNFLPNSQSTKKAVEFTVEEKSAYDALDGVGFLINSSITGTYPSTQVINGYLLFFQYNYSGIGTSIKLFKLENVNAYNLHHTYTSNTFDSNNVPGATLLATASYSTAKFKKIKIEIQPDSVQLWFAAAGDASVFSTTLGDTNQVTWSNSSKSYPLTAGYDMVGSSEVFRGGYGPLISYRSHACDRLTHFQMANLSMTQDYVRSLTEIIREPNWHYDYDSFLVNLNESPIEDFSKEYTTAEIINRLKDDDITYIGWCGSANVAASQVFLNQLGGGALININDTETDTYAKQIDAIADAIVSAIESKSSPNAHTFLTTDQFSFSSTDANLNDGAWSVGYSISGYGISETVRAYADLATASFTTPGYYQIYHGGDTTTNIAQIRIHEAPVAAFSLTASASGGIGVTNKSYDPEFCTDASAATGSTTDGISTSKFEYMNLVEESPFWTITAPASLTANDVWLVRLTVTDADGITATTVKQVSLNDGGSTTVAIPYNSFILSNTTLVKNINSALIITDQSYSLNGTDTVTGTYEVKDAVGETKTTFTLDGSETKVLDASGYAVGTYSVSMTATATAGSNTSAASAAVSRTFKVVNGYVVSYQANGGIGEPSNQVKIEDETLALASTVPTRNGYVFKYWTDISNNIFRPGDTYTGNSPLSLTAQWKVIPILTLSNKMTVYTGNAAAIDAPMVTGATANTFTYTYYSDSACTSIVSPVNAGTYYVKASVVETEDYTASTSNIATLTITPATLAITVSDKTAVYTGSAINIDAANVTGVEGIYLTSEISYTYYTDISCTTLTTNGNSGAASNGAAPVKAGNYYAKATIAGTANYTSATTAAPATLEISATNGGSLSMGDNLVKYYGDPSFMLSATGGNGTGAVTFTSSNPSVVSVTADGYVTINAVGTTTIIAIKAADRNYNAQTASITVTVNPKAVTYAITNDVKTYTGGEQYATVAPSVSSLKEGVDYTVTYKQGDTVVTKPTEKGDYTITVSTINSNYTGSAMGTLVISRTGQSELKITGVPARDIQYSDTFNLTANGGSGSGSVTWSSSDDNLATVDPSTGAVTITGVGTVTITATKASDGNYDGQTAVVSFTTTPKVITVTATATDRDYIAGRIDVDVTLSTGVPDVTASYTFATVLTAYAGNDKEVTVTGVSLSNDKYTPASTTIYTTVTISPIEDTPLTIDGVPSSIIYGNDDFTLTASSTGSGPVTWRSDDSAVLRVNSSTGVVTINGVGSAKITASKASDGSYDAQSAFVDLEVGPRGITYAITNNTKPYTGGVQYATVTSSVYSLVEGVDYTVVYSQNDSEVEEPTEAGEYDITVTTNNDNYSGNSTEAKLTIQAVDQTYKLQVGGLPSYIEYEDTFALYANGGNGEGDVSWRVESGDDYATVDSTTGVVEITGVGTVTITAVKEGDGNYNEQERSLTFTVNKKEIDLAISNTAKNYTGTVQAVTVTGTPTKNHMLSEITEVSYEMQEDTSETVFRNVGTYNVSAAITEDYDEYYVLNRSTTAVATIAKSNLTIIADNKIRTYGEDNPTLTLSYTLLGMDQDVEFEFPTITCTADASSVVGNYAITLSYDGDHGNNNYNITLVNGNLTITKKALDITAQPKTITFGDAPANDGVTYSGFVNGEDASSLGGTLAYSYNVYKQGDNAGIYRDEIIPSGLTSDNYDINFTAGNLTVVPQPVTLQANGSTSKISVKLSTAVSGLTLDKFIVKQGENIITPTLVTESYNGARYTIEAPLTSSTEYTVTVDNCPNYTFSSAAFTATSSGGGGGGGSMAANPKNNTISVKETSSTVFDNSDLIEVTADMTNAFSNSVEVKISDDTETAETIFHLVGNNSKVYPFDISLYEKGTSTKVQPKSGYKVTITLPLPKELWDERESVRAVTVTDGKLIALKSTLVQKDGVWCISFEAEHFSPYALVVDSAWHNPYRDVAETSWFFDAVKYMSVYGLMNGTSETTFGPNISTSRAMIVTILWRLEGEPAAIAPISFKDVASSTWYADAVAWAVENDIVKGYDANNFGPNKNITREQMTAILYRYAGYKNFDVSNTADLSAYTDNNIISGYALNAFAWSVNEKLISGLTPATLQPKNEATRAQVAAIFMRFSENIAK